MGLLPITTSSKPDRLREYLEVWTDQDATGSPGLTLTDQEVGQGTVKEDAGPPLTHEDGTYTLLLVVLVGGLISILIACAQVLHTSSTVPPLNCAG
jgi:hypothetical protein